MWAPHSRMPPPWKSKKPRQPPLDVRAVVRPPRGRAEPQVPVALVLRRLGLGRQPVVADGRVQRVGVDGGQLAELAGVAEIGGEDEVGDAAPLGAGLIDRGRSGASCRPGPGSRRWSSSRAFRSRCPCPPWPRRSRPSCASGRRWRSARRRCPRAAASRGSRGTWPRRGRTSASVRCLTASRRVFCGVGDGDELHDRLVHQTAQHVAAASADADAGQGDPLAGGDAAVLAQHRPGTNIGAANTALALAAVVRNRRRLNVDLR